MCISRLHIKRISTYDIFIFVYGVNTKILANSFEFKQTRRYIGVVIIHVIKRRMYRYYCQNHILFSIFFYVLCVINIFSSVQRKIVRRRHRCMNYYTSMDILCVFNDTLHYSVYFKTNYKYKRIRIPIYVVIDTI